MTDAEIFEDLKKILNKQFSIDEDKIEEESYFDSDLNITDLDIEDLLNTLSQKYDIDIPQEKASSFKKVSDLVNYIFESADATS